MSDERNREAESRRIINRVGAETEASMVKRARNHITGHDADHNDWVELWGTRIGRVLALVLLGYILYVLVSYIATN